MSNALPLPAGLTYSPTPVAFHGIDDREPNDYGRRVVVIPGRTWPARPEQCTDTSAHGEWASDHPDAPLICAGCGLDVG